MNPRRLLFALSATLLLLVAPHAALADRHDYGDRWGDGYSDQGDRHWEHGYRHRHHGDRYACNHNKHRYWSRARHCWIYDQNYYWDASAYHWIPDNGGNFILVHLSF